ncbi:helix-turn-helix domain-containing protein [Actibacterium sp. 188UL27-1]|uniref:helix-turn-helix domain-containing protein n=1 Tax=Actibacterium sp. 188UL27-1 TaxID=2786961 RepID=UPI00195D875D|nr:helix-turn-helix transcriptional regulator [Actibacterium sp. 188UL27-1]MBM7069868.1 helix-turn-helix transcriptional regulator [Actibacterium sp. 188UL27-1]
MERRNERLISSFATALRRRRKAAGLSQEELAFKTDLSTSYISLLETKNRQPTLTVLAAICEQLDVSMGDFITDIEST